MTRGCLPCQQNTAELVRHHVRLGVYEHASAAALQSVDAARVCVPVAHCVLQRQQRHHSVCWHIPDPTQPRPSFREIFIVGAPCQPKHAGHASRACFHIENAVGVPHTLVRVLRVLQHNEHIFEACKPPVPVRGLVQEIHLVSSVFERLQVREHSLAPGVVRQPTRHLNLVGLAHHHGACPRAHVLHTNPRHAAIDAGGNLTVQRFKSTGICVVPPVFEHVHPLRWSATCSVTSLALHLAFHTHRRIFAGQRAFAVCRAQFASAVLEALQFLACHLALALRKLD